MGYDIRQVIGQADYRAITKLRYAVYASEEGLEIPGMDHRERTLIDPADAAAIILGVFESGRAIATISVTPMRALGLKDGVRSFFGSAAFPVDESRQALIGRLMILSPYRGSPVCLQLFKAVFGHIVRAGFAVGFVESSPRTIPLYESIGCRRYGRACGHPAYGLLVPMAIIADDRYFERIRSPLRNMIPACAQYTELSRWFECTLVRGCTFASVRAMSRQSFDAAVGSLYTEVSPFFGMPPSEVKSLLRQCTVLDIDAGTTILPHTSVGTELYLVASGLVESASRDAAVRREKRAIGPGGGFADGRFRWSDSAPIGRQTRAVEPTRLLAISHAAFAVIVKSHPAIAARLLASLDCGLVDRATGFQMASEEPACENEELAGLLPGVGRLPATFSERATAR